MPKINLVTPHQRLEIISGKDFNLAKLLLPDGDDFRPQEILLSAGEAVSVQQKKDARLSKLLSLSDFLKAFNIYYRVMIEAYPHRASELDMYRSNLCDLEKSYGSSFYKYHVLFSKKASAALLNEGIIVDWSSIDYDIYLSVFSGRRANSCDMCAGVDHSTEYCTLRNGSGPVNSLKGANTSSKYPKRVTLDDGIQVCDRHNNNICNKPADRCTYHHVCLYCLSKDHIKSECARPPPKAQQGAKRSISGGQRSENAKKH